MIGLELYDQQNESSETMNLADRSEYRPMLDFRESGSVGPTVNRFRAFLVAACAAAGMMAWEPPAALSADGDPAPATSLRFYGAQAGVAREGASADR